MENKELEELIDTCNIEDLKKRFFKDFGCINFKSDEFFHELNLARAFHEWDMKINPKDHKISKYYRYRCYHVIECSCGFSEACDSSD